MRCMVISMQNTYYVKDVHIHSLPLQSPSIGGILHWAGGVCGGGRVGPLIISIHDPRCGENGGVRSKNTLSSSCLAFSVSAAHLVSFDLCFSILVSHIVSLIPIPEPTSLLHVLVDQRIR